MLGEPRQNARGVVVAGCGLSLGDDEAHLELDPDETTIGHRCAACQGMALRVAISRS